jgi:uncharacterized protein
VSDGRVLCIWHGNCQDGFGAAWAVRYALGDGVEFHAGVYQEPPPDVTGRDVIIVDFSYKRPVLEDMAAVAKSILILDHHKSAQEDLAPFSVEYHGGARFGADVPGIIRELVELGRPPIVALFDMERSGAGMVWDALIDEPRPPLINHIEDRDLWRFALPKTREIAAALFSYPYDFGLWDSLMSEDMLGYLIVEGGAIERKHHQDIENLLPVVRREMVIGGLRMPVACLPLTLTSDAGHRMAREAGAGVAACYWDTPDGRVFSLRSNNDGPDVSGIAKHYGGGGHARASGFRMPIGWEGDDGGVSVRR